MSAVSGHEKMCAEIAEALGIKHCRRLELHMEMNEVVTVTAEFYPQRDEMQYIAPILKKYKLELVEIE